jgi:thiamine-phosphate pyrophosphorylase
MPDKCIFYYITDRTAFAADERTRRLRLLAKIAEAASAGLHYIQLREKDLSARDLESLAREAVQIILNQNKLRTENRESRTALLINSRTDVALAVEADGIHLPVNDVSPAEVRRIWKCGAVTSVRELSPEKPLISISCHSPQEVAEAASIQANLALFAPVFEKKDALSVTPSGLESLRQASLCNIPVLALGGITLQNAESCLRAGAAGIAAIRLFQENDIAAVIRRLRALN